MLIIAVGRERTKSEQRELKRVFFATLKAD